MIAPLKLFKVVGKTAGSRLIIVVEPPPEFTVFTDPNVPSVLVLAVPADVPSIFKYWIPRTPVDSAFGIIAPQAPEIPSTDLYQPEKLANVFKPSFSVCIGWWSAY